MEMKASNLLLCNFILEHGFKEVTDPEKQLNVVFSKYCQRRDVNVSNLDTTGQAQVVDIITNFLAHYLKSKNNYFKISQEFGKSLFKSDLKLSTNLIRPLTNFIGIEFPFSFKLSENFFSKNVLLCVDKTKHGQKLLIIMIPLVLNNVALANLLMVLDLTKDFLIDHNMESMIKSIAFQHKLPMEYLKELISYVFKCLIYIQSSNPDLVPEKGATTKKTNPEKVATFYRHNNPFDLITVGYSFHGRHYSDKEFTVSGHPRWQPCGPGFSQVKLIWIDEYAKNKKSA